MGKEKWTQEEVLKHIKTNKESTYSMAVVLAALYRKLYGELPKGLGLSGQQAEFADSLFHKLPQPKSKEA